MSVRPRLLLLAFAFSFGFLILGSRAGAVTITAAELPEGQVSVVGAGDAIEIWNDGELDRILQQEEAEFRQSMGSA